MAGLGLICITIPEKNLRHRFSHVVEMMVPRFGRNPTELCLIFNEVLDFIYTSHRHRLQNWDRNPFLQPDQLHRYADAIHQQGRHLVTVLVLWMALLEVLLV